VSAFQGQTQTEYFAANNITELVIPESVVKIQGMAFNWIDNLKSVTLPNGIKVITEGAFGKCANLTTINLPTSLEEIRSGAFNNCGELANLTIPSSLTSVVFETDSIWGKPFGGCQKLPIKTRQTLERLGYKYGF